MSTDNEKKFYRPFNPLPEDGKENEYRYRLVPTSKMHVRRVCDVQAKRMSLSDQQRCKYADQANYKNVAGENTEVAMALEKLEGNTDLDTDIAISKVINRIRALPEFELHDVFNEYYAHAALAEAVFAGFPKLLEVKETEEGWNVEIVNQELFDRLDEGVVNEAFLHFSRNRSGIQQGLTSS